MTESTTVTVEGFELEVWYNYSPACKGRTEEGQKMEPDAPAEVEIEVVRLDVHDITSLLSEDINILIREAIIEQHHDREHDAPDYEEDDRHDLHMRE